MVFGVPRVLFPVLAVTQTMVPRRSASSETTLFGTTVQQLHAPDALRGRVGSLKILEAVLRCSHAVARAGASAALIDRTRRARLTASVAGYSGTPLSRKLGIKPGARVALVRAPDGFDATLDPLPDGVRL